MDPSEPITTSNNHIDSDVATLDTLIQAVEVESDETTSDPDPVSQYLLNAGVYSDSILTRGQRSFFPKLIGSHKSSLHRSYLLCTLRSYPRMMLRGQRPPFIHAQSDFSRDFQPGEKSIPGPLAVCDELLHMYTMKNEDNVLRIWRAIRMEQVRLLTEVRSFSPFSPFSELRIHMGDKGLIEI